ncbi:hypothetical protein JYU34_003856 [Plutella xylostella]|uniref:Uncharacterized protein n=1 Tax=Plutella xylostella TaxID=51655 RepID=A0ABQ7R124_PLUXY|nr:hypothetical protein JYU34_003856 [Plutella xylostella]
MSRTQILDDVGEPPAKLEAPKPAHHFPPYPPHSEEPPTVAEAVDRGNEVRRTEKNKRHKPIRKLPRMAKPGQRSQSAPLGPHDSEPSAGTPALPGGERRGAQLPARGDGAAAASPGAGLVAGACGEPARSCG